MILFAPVSSWWIQVDLGYGRIWDIDCGGEGRKCALVSELIRGMIQRVANSNTFEDGEESSRVNM